MKLRWVTAIILLATLGIPARLSAQERQHKKGEPHRYIFKDLGTFGGPQSSVGSGFVGSALNNLGAVVGGADTPSMLDPNANANPEFSSSDGFVSHAFKWQNDVLRDLAVLPGGGVNSGAIAINDRGAVVGISEKSDPLLGVPEIAAVLWRHGKINSLFETPGVNESAAFAINKHDQVVGFYQNTTPDPFPLLSFGTQTRAFLWEEGKIMDLGTLSGGNDALAFLVNDRGQVAGIAETAPDPTTSLPNVHAFLWDDDRMFDLDTLGGPQASANWLNNRGQVVGDADTTPDPNTGLANVHPFLWDGRMFDLGTLGGATGTARWVNDEGEVVGAADISGGQASHAFLWEDGVMADLGVLAGDMCSIALAINSSGQVVGSSSDMCQGSGIGRAFLWEDGHMIDLNTFVPPGSNLQLPSAQNINDRGEITGTGVLPTGEMHAFLLIPCEENTLDCMDGSANNEAMTRKTVQPTLGTATMLGRKSLAPRPMGAWVRERMALARSQRGGAPLPPK